MTKNQEQILEGHVDAVRGMELLLDQKRDLLSIGYQTDELVLFPGMLVLKLEDGEVRWMVFDNEYKMEIWKA